MNRREALLHARGVEALGCPKRRLSVSWHLREGLAFVFLRYALGTLPPSRVAGFVEALAAATYGGPGFVVFRRVCPHEVGARPLPLSTDWDGWRAVLSVTNQTV